MHRSMLPALTHNNLLLQATCCILQVISRALQVVLIFGLQHWMQQALHQIRKILGALLTPVMMNRHLIIILRQLHWFFLPMEELEWVDMTFFPAPGHLVIGPNLQTSGTRLIQLKMIFILQAKAQQEIFWKIFTSAPTVLRNVALNYLRLTK